MKIRNATLFLDRHTRLVSQQRGVTLVELMIAMLLGIFLTGGLFLTFNNSKQAYRYQNGLSQIQEQGRFAISFLTKSVRVAGFPGDNMPPGNRIEGTDGVTDSVTIRLRDDRDCRDMPTAGVATNRFRISGGNLQCSGDGIAWDDYVPNVEDMQIWYGEDLDADGIANRYVTATEGPAWANVVTTRVSLMIRSTDNATSEPETYMSLLGNTVVAQDKRLRKPFVTTIALRN